jgi:hypothetical protein
LIFQKLFILREIAQIIKEGITDKMNQNNQKNQNKQNQKK